MRYQRTVVAPPRPQLRAVLISSERRVEHIAPNCALDRAAFAVGQRMVKPVIGEGDRDGDLGAIEKRADHPALLPARRCGKLRYRAAGLGERRRSGGRLGRQRDESSVDQAASPTLDCCTPLLRKRRRRLRQQFREPRPQPGVGVGASANLGQRRRREEEVGMGRIKPRNGAFDPGAIRAVGRSNIE